MHSPEHTLPPLVRPSNERWLAGRLPAARHLLLLLCLLACAALTTVSVQQARQSADLATTPWSDGRATDTAQPPRQAMRLIEQSRGLEALHLLQLTEVRKHALDMQLRQYRRELDALLARSAAQTTDASSTAVIVALRADAAEYAALQDQLLGLSRQALTEPAAAARAQQVLTGPSHAVFERLHDRLDRWWTVSESQAQLQRLSKQQQQAQIANTWWTLAVAGAGALAATLALALRLLGVRNPVRRLRVLPTPTASLQAQEQAEPSPLSSLDPQTDASVTSQRVLAISAAVMSWRHDKTAVLPWATLTP